MKVEDFANKRPLATGRKKPNQVKECSGIVVHW